MDSLGENPREQKEGNRTKKEDLLLQEQQSKQRSIHIKLAWWTAGKRPSS